MKSRFNLGTLLITPAAQEALNANGQDPHQFLTRHAKGDWGIVCEHDCQANDDALIHGDRLLSVYQCHQARIWIITEADRSATTILLPEDY